MSAELLWQLKRDAGGCTEGGISAFGAVDVLKLKGLNVDLENLAEKPAGGLRQLELQVRFRTRWQAD
ncbi:MAG: hypothetical protein ACKESB_03520 [Candidatus Hodgkinia cicadicola]